MSSIDSENDSEGKGIGGNSSGGTLGLGMSSSSSISKDSPSSVDKDTRGISSPTDMMLSESKRSVVGRADENEVLVGELEPRVIV
jgi:hypothetical protein